MLKSVRPFAPATPRMNVSKWLDTRFLRRAGSQLRDGAAAETTPADLARVLCIASGKGGTGKSVVSCNLAVQRARLGDRVCLIDFDAGLANDHLLLGVAPRFDLGHLLEGAADLSEALVEGPHGVQLLSGGVGRHGLADPTRRDLDRLFRLLAPLERRFDLIVVDHGAGIGYSIAAHLAATSALLLVTNCEVTALSDAYAIYKRALAVNPDVRAGLVVNRAPDEGRAQAAFERFSSVARQFLEAEPELVGFIRDDRCVPDSVECRLPVTIAHPESSPAQALGRIARWGGFDLPPRTEAFYARARRALR